MEIEATRYQLAWINLGKVYADIVCKNKQAFWDLIRKSDNILTCMVSCYDALRQTQNVETRKSLIVPIEELHKSNPEKYKRFEDWVYSFDPEVTPARRIKLIKTLIALEFLTKN